MITHALARRLGRLDKMARQPFRQPADATALHQQGRQHRRHRARHADESGRVQRRAGAHQQTCSRILRSAEGDLRNAESITSNLQQQQAETNQVATAITQMAESIHEVPQLHRRLRPALDETAELFREGNRSVQETIGAVEGCTASSPPQKR
jgi:methyl-accepting chemotaxis protein